MDTYYAIHVHAHTHKCKQTNKQTNTLLLAAGNKGLGNINWEDRKKIKAVWQCSQIKLNCP
jgi:hypothetical protein